MAKRNCRELLRDAFERIIQALAAFLRENHLDLFPLGFKDLHGACLVARQNGQRVFNVFHDIGNDHGLERVEHLGHGHARVAVFVCQTEKGYVCDPVFLDQLL